MTVVDAAKIIALVSTAFMCASIGGAAIDVRVTLNAIEKDVHAVTEQASNALVTLNAGTDAISWQAVKTLEDAGSTLRQARRTISKVDPSLDQLHTDLQEGYSVAHDARLSLDNVNKAAIDERFYFERDLPPLMDAIKADVVGAGDTLAAGKTLLADPNLHRIIANSGDMTDSGKHILADAEFEVNKLAHPSKKRLTFWTATEAGGDYARHFMPPIF